VHRGYEGGGRGSRREPRGPENFQNKRRLRGKKREGLIAGATLVLYKGNVGEVTRSTGTRVEREMGKTGYYISPNSENSAEMLFGLRLGNFDHLLEGGGKGWRSSLTHRYRSRKGTGGGSTTKGSKTTFPSHTLGALERFFDNLYWNWGNGRNKNAWIQSSVFASKGRDNGPNSLEDKDRGMG